MCALFSHSQHVTSLYSLFLHRLSLMDSKPDTSFSHSSFPPLFPSTSSSSPSVSLPYVALFQLPFAPLSPLFSSRPSSPPPPPPPRCVTLTSCFTQPCLLARGPNGISLSPPLTPPLVPHGVLLSFPPTHPPRPPLPPIRPSRPPKIPLFPSRPHGHFPCKL